MENLLVVNNDESQLVLWQAACDSWGPNSPTAQRILLAIDMQDSEVGSMPDRLSRPDAVTLNIQIV